MSAAAVDLACGGLGDSAAWAPEEIREMEGRPPNITLVSWEAWVKLAPPLGAEWDTSDPEGILGEARQLGGSD
ncbi:MAG: hypothetical protein OXG37_07575 [Actinomycetia bacterium]|nr:hypothetical protein [Actinomycetes bacterium]